MASQYLLDTNTASYIIKGYVLCVRHRLVRVPMAQVFISAVTEGELHYGLARRQGAARLQRMVEEFLLRVTVLPWGSEAAKQYGHLRADLDRLGQPMGNLAMMIVSLAFRRLGKRDDVDPVIHRHLGLVTLVIGYEFAGFYIDGDVVFVVGALLRRRLDRPVREQSDIFEQVLDQILQVRRRLFTQSVDQGIGGRIRWFGVCILLDDLAQRPVDGILADHLSQVVEHDAALAIMNVSLIGLDGKQRPLLKSLGASGGPARVVFLQRPP